MGDKAINSFEVEAKELLAIMEDSLLQLENNPGDSDLINAIFRSAHTIKGTGGVFGFDNIVEFTHVVENVLDKVRSGDVDVDSELIALLLSCTDQMSVLVQIAVDGDEELDDSVRENGESLHAQLNGYMDGTDSASLSKEIVDSIATAEDIMVADHWHISIRYDKEVLQNGMDPISFLRYLDRLGEIISVTILHDDLPDLADTNAELCYLGYEVNFYGEVDKAQIESVFEFVVEMCHLHITPPKEKIDMYIEMLDQLPDEEMKLGEILVATGAVTQHELDDALREQSELNEDVIQEKLGEVLVKEHIVHQETVDAALEKQAQVAERIKSQNRVLRVDAEKLDKLINLVGELVIAGASSNLLAHHLGDERLLESMSTMARLVEEIRDSALYLRMVQIGETFNRFQRVVRDVSKELGKNIKLEINGAETELDKTVVEKIGDPLMHLVRNSMDHGIESAEERKAAGKPEQGILKLNAYHDSGSIVIEVIDDGRGLSREKILDKAREKGISFDENISDHDVYRMIFEAGLSTAKEVTNLSGRGVGMDVVKRNIEALRGNVDVTSEIGKGTTVSIRLPLTLAIIDGFLVGVGESSYVIPLDLIHECIELNQEEQKEVATQSYINLRGEVLPFLRLREFFKDNAKEKSRENIVVVQFGNQKAGFVVDELLGEFQTVIKPMSKILQKLQGISGATILGSGDVAVILDVPTLVQRATHLADPSHKVGKAGDDAPVLH
ncbi:MAG: chemotaxis protein CheA [Gammaproteobacteria bacterium]|nr:chemotaxis protein CheA [Gammaproteobacteria bacterium]